MSSGGPEDCGGTDEGRAGEPGKVGALCAGEEESADGNKTSETTCQSPKRELALLIEIKADDSHGT